MAYLANVLKFRRDITIFFSIFCHKFLMEMAGKKEGGKEVRQAGRKEGTMGERKEEGRQERRKFIINILHILNHIFSWQFLH